MKPPYRPRDFSQRALQVVGERTGSLPKQEPEPEREKNPHAVALAKLGSSKGGVARAKKRSPEKRKAIASKASLARWRKTG